jgi:hypothetical protein
VRVSEDGRSRGEHRGRLPNAGRSRQRLAGITGPPREHRERELPVDRHRLGGVVLGPELRDVDVELSTAATATAATVTAATATATAVFVSASAAATLSVASAAAAVPAEATAVSTAVSSVAVATTAAASAAVTTSVTGAVAAARHSPCGLSERKRVPELDEDLLGVAGRR